MIFLNSASSAAALVFYLPGVCTHTDTEGKQRKARVRNILKDSKKTQYLMNTLYLKAFEPVIFLKLSAFQNVRIANISRQNPMNYFNLIRYKSISITYLFPPLIGHVYNLQHGPVSICLLDLA